MRTLYFANGARGVRCLEAMIAAGHRVAGVVAHPGSAAGGDVSSMRTAAERFALPLYEPRDVNHQEFTKLVRDIAPDLNVLAGYSRILCRTLWSLPPEGTINLHGGLLPHYRGASPINWQILNGEPAGGCAILRVDDGIDTGDILCQATYPIDLAMTAGEAQAKTLELFPKMLLEVLARLARGDAHGEPQDPTLGSYYGKRYPWDGEIDWQGSTDRQVHDLVRALNGPGLSGAFTSLGDTRVVVHRTRLIEEEIRGSCGRIALRRSNGVVVICKNRGLLITEIIAGAEMVPAQEHFKIRGDTFGASPRSRSDGRQVEANGAGGEAFHAVPDDLSPRERATSRSRARS